MMRYFRRNVQRGSKIEADFLNTAERRATDQISAQGLTVTRSNGKVLLRGQAAAGRGGGSGTPWVAVLPPIPEYGSMSVIWGKSTQIAGGTGDGQIWDAVSGQSAWTPRQVFTTLSGIPV